MCLSDVSVVGSESDYLVSIEGCMGPNLQYFFGIKEEEREIPLYGPTLDKYAILKIPAGEYEIIAWICDQSMTCITRVTAKAKSPKD